MRAFPPAPFPRKGMTTVRKLCLLRKDNSAPPWDGPAEAQ
jgi:hypothetical protein